MERTLLIIKPDAVSQRVVGRVLQRIEDEGFRIVGMELLQQTYEQAAEFYAVHKGKPFYRGLLEFMTSGPCVPVVLERADAVRYLREVVGATNPREAAKGTIREAFGNNVQQNAVHASDSSGNGAREIALFFGDQAAIQSYVGEAHT